MPVKFFPEKPIELLEKFITKEDGTPLNGEIDIYRKLHIDLNTSETEWYVWHNLNLPFHSNSFNPQKKTSAQIDFLILSNLGVLVLEVKGGKIIFRNNEFHFDHQGIETKIKQDPYHQAEGYKYTLKDHVLNVGNKCLICHAVCFPHSKMTFDSPILDSNILWTQALADKYNNSIEKFILAVFKYNRDKHTTHNRRFPNLQDFQVQNIKTILSPLVKDVNKFYNRDTHEWLNINNLELLDALKKNDRIMLEGGPGTGKTTLAKAYLDKQLTKKGIYLCWNNFLMHHMKYLLKERGLFSNCEVTTYSRFLLSLFPQLKYRDLLEATVSEFHGIVKNGISDLRRLEKMVKYDYVVIDEGQDVFDRGADILVNELVGQSGDGLMNGRCLILYDIDQSYFAERRDVTDMSDLLSEYCAHFKLNEFKRSAQNPDIRLFAEQLISSESEISFDQSKYPGVPIHYFKSLSSIKDYLVKNVLLSIRNKNSSLHGGDCIVLIESRLMKEYGQEEGMNYLLTIRDMEELSEINIDDPSNVLRYTTMLKFKGMERENVFLVISKPEEFNRYEIYVGATRAISHLEVLMLD